MVIDTHCHLSIDDYDNLKQVIKNMDDNIMIVSGVNTKSNMEVLNLASKYKNIYATIGIHPEEITESIERDIMFVEENINNPKVVGIGEIGLDYHYCKDNKDEQKKWFIKQLQLAKKYDKCVVVHSRDATLDTYEILKESGNNKVNIHCFSGSLDVARNYINLGYYLGIGGVVTFKNADKIKEVVKNVDLSYLLLETDSPYLTPEPYRGKKNEPANVYQVAKKIAEIKEIPIARVLEITTNNAIAQFDLDKFL